MNSDGDSLNGLSVLVTRPSDQAGPLTDLIRERGGRPLSYPLLEILPLKMTGKLQTIIDTLDRYRAIIFISRNAVQHGLPWLQERIDNARQTLYAIGKTTAAALQATGFTEVRQPEDSADSEGLLALPELQADRIRDCHVLVVRGIGGRELLKQSLIERGAKVDYAEVYERIAPCYDAAGEHEFWQQQSPDIIMFTSREAVDNLLRRLPVEFRNKVLNTHTVVMSRRIADYVRGQGFEAEPGVVDQPDDHGIVKKCEEIARSMTA